jgi:NADH-quinone oxidoreductase subunit L
LYAKPEQDIRAVLQTENRPLWYTVIYRKFYIDEVYLFVTHRIIFRLIAAPSKWFDRTIVDGTVDMVGALFGIAGYFVRFYQSGRLRVYLATSLMGILFIYYMSNRPY